MKHGSAHPTEGRPNAPHGAGVSTAGRVRDEGRVVPAGGGSRGSAEAGARGRGQPRRSRLHVASGGTGHREEAEDLRAPRRDPLRQAMEEMIFVDATAWIAYEPPEDRNHEAALAAMKAAQRSEYGALVTSDYVLSESLTAG